MTMQLSERYRISADRFIDAFAKEEMELTKTERLLSKLLKVAGVEKKAGLYAIIATDTEDRKIEMMEFLGYFSDF